MTRNPTTRQAAIRRVLTRLCISLLVGGKLRELNHLSDYSARMEHLADEAFEKALQVLKDAPRKPTKITAEDACLELILTETCFLIFQERGEEPPEWFRAQRANAYTTGLKVVAP